jgi:hypothetical protein
MTGGAQQDETLRCMLSGAPVLDPLDVLGRRRVVGWWRGPDRARDLSLGPGRLCGFYDGGAPGQSVHRRHRQGCGGGWRNDPQRPNCEVLFCRRCLYERVSGGTSSRRYLLKSATHRLGTTDLDPRVTRCRYPNVRRSQRARRRPLRQTHLSDLCPHRGSIWTKQWLELLRWQRITGLGKSVQPVPCGREQDAHYAS